jgi:2'-5' RNA ligase
MAASQISRKFDRRSRPPSGRTLYWHVLMADQPEVIDLARQAADRLAPFTGLHLTPLDRLHMTTFVVGPADDVTEHQLQKMIRIAADHQGGIGPIPVSLGKVLYHAEAIMVAVSPAAALTPIRSAALAATEQVGLQAAGELDWTPHVTLCYSTADQPAPPIIKALGRHMPQRNINVSSLSLVIQDGPERQWHWITVGTVRIHAPALA